MQTRLVRQHHRLQGNMQARQTLVHVVLANGHQAVAVQAFSPNKTGDGSVCARCNKLHMSSLAYLLSRRPLLVSGAVSDACLEAAPLAVAPPESLAGTSGVVSRCALILVIVPLSCNARVQRLEGVA